MGNGMLKITRTSVSAPGGDPCPFLLLHPYPPPAFASFYRNPRQNTCQFSPIMVAVISIWLLFYLSAQRNRVFPPSVTCSTPSVST